MKNIIHRASALAAVSILALSACTGRNSFDSELRTAETAIAEGDMQAALSVAAHLAGRADTARLSATELARLSMVYIRLAEHPDGTEMAANAVNSYIKAYETDPDSARIYFESLSPEQVPTAEFLYHLVTSGDADYDTGDHEMPDSLINDTDTIR